MKRLIFPKDLFLIKQEIKLIAKADLKSDLTNFGVDLFNKLNGKKHYGINRIRIYEEDENGNNTYY